MITANISKAFVQTELARNKNDNKIVMKIRDLLVSMLVDINPNVYENYVAHEGIQKLKESTRQYTE